MDPKIIDPKIIDPKSIYTKIMDNKAMIRRYLPYGFVYLLGICSWWTWGELRAASADPVRPSLGISASQTARAETHRKATDLGKAAAKGDIRTVRKLLAAKANTDRRDAKGRTPLRLAAGAGHEEIARLLIRAGGDIDAATRSGETPLMIAARRGDPAMAHLLLEGGARIDAADTSGSTAGDIAERHGNDVVFELIADETARRKKAGGAIARAQTLLAGLGYRTGRADGVMGPRTRDAIRRFQSTRRLGWNGTVTPNLIAALERASRNRARNSARIAPASTRQIASASAEQQDGWFKRTTARVSDYFRDPTDTPESASAEQQGPWYKRTASQVGSFLRANKEREDALARRCAEEGNRWIRDPENDSWTDCADTN